MNKTNILEQQFTELLSYIENKRSEASQAVNEKITLHRARAETKFTLVMPSDSRVIEDNSARLGSWAAMCLKMRKLSKRHLDN